MRILWLSHFLPYPPEGGALQRSHNLVTNIAKIHEVSLVSLNQPRILAAASDVSRAVEALQAENCRVDWFPIPSESSRIRWITLVGTTFLSSQPYAARWFTSREMLAYLEGLDENRKPDLVHVDTVGLAPYMKALPGIPFVLNHHNIESHMSARRAEQESNPLKRLYFARDASKLARMEQGWVRRAAANLVVSELDGERLIETVPGCRVQAVENGVDLDFFKPSVPFEDQSGLVFTGTYSWYPNVKAVRDILTRLWPALIADDPERTFTFVGKDPFPDLLAAASSDERIRVTGFVDDVRPFLDQAAVFVCPIQDGGGTRLKILDALAMAKPLVATGMAVEGLDMTDEQHYLRAESPQDFVRQIVRLERDVDLRARLGTAGRHHVEGRFGWDEITRRLDRAYRESMAPSVV